MADRWSWTLGIEDRTAPLEARIAGVWLFIEIIGVLGKPVAELPSGQWDSIECVMPTRNINLTEHLDRLIDAEVVREGLRLIERRNEEERAKLEWLRGAIQVGLDQIDEGSLTEIRSADELERQIDQLWREAATETAQPGERA